MPQKTSEALTHTHTGLGFTLSSFQLLESAARSLLDLTLDYGSFSSAPARLFPLGVKHGHEQEQTLSTQHLLKGLLPPGGGKSISTCPQRHKAL